MQSCVTIFCVFAFCTMKAQAPQHVAAMFPEGTIFHQNIQYAGDTLVKHRLDIYLPAKTNSSLPLVVWVHGGAWNHNDKYADMGYMKETVRSFIEKGYAFAS